MWALFICVLVKSFKRMTDRQRCCCCPFFCLFHFNSILFCKQFDIMMKIYGNIAPIRLWPNHIGIKNEKYFSNHILLSYSWLNLWFNVTLLRMTVKFYSSNVTVAVKMEKILCVQLRMGGTLFFFRRHHNQFKMKYSHCDRLKIPT